MTEVFNELSSSPPGKARTPEDLLQFIQPHVVRASTIPMPIALERGAATIPLSGIDIPFHSKYLRSGIPSYRRFLEGKILEQNIDVDALIGKFIPNVTAKPFAVTRSYIKEAAGITGSSILRDLLETVSLWPLAFRHGILLILRVM